MSSIVTESARSQQSNTELAGDPANTVLAGAPGLQAVPSLRTNFKWTFAGSVIYAACQWGMLSILAKAGSATIVGQFALGLAIAAPVFMFTNVNLRAVQATDARSEFEFCDYFTLRMLASALGLLTVFAVAWTLHYDWTTRLVVMLVAVAKAVESLSDVVAGLLQKFERLDQVAISLMIRGALSVAGFGGAYLATHSLPLAVVAMVLTWTAVFAVYDLWRARELMGGKPVFFRLRGAILKRLLIVSLPLGIVMALISVNINIPRYLLVKFMGQADLGIFASLAYLLIAVSLVTNALGQSASARLARMFGSGSIRIFENLMLKLLALGTAALVCAPLIAAFTGRYVLALMYSPEYARHVDVFVIMSVGAGISAVVSFLGYGLTAARLFRVQAPIKGLGTIVTTTLSVLLLPHYGLIGAAIAVVGSELACAAVSGAVLWSAIRKVGA